MVKLRNVIKFLNGQPPRIINRQPLRITIGLSRNACQRHLNKGIEIRGGKEYFKGSEHWSSRIRRERA